MTRSETLQVCGECNRQRETGDNDKRKQGLQNSDCGRGGWGRERRGGGRGRCHMDPSYVFFMTDSSEQGLNSTCCLELSKSSVYMLSSYTH